ncbi:hypothetical protein EIL50_04470 [bacterium NHP-B]|nr:hypothetical protein EIL50_04470 [bacterium NHP-B]
MIHILNPARRATHAFFLSALLLSVPMYAADPDGGDAGPAALTQTVPASADTAKAATQETAFQPDIDPKALSAPEIPGFTAPEDSLTAKHLTSSKTLQAGLIGLQTSFLPALQEKKRVLEDEQKARFPHGSPQPQLDALLDKENENGVLSPEDTQKKADLFQSLIDVKYDFQKTLTDLKADIDLFIKLPYVLVWIAQACEESPHKTDIYPENKLRPDGPLPIIWPLSYDYGRVAEIAQTSPLYPEQTVLEVLNNLPPVMPFFEKHGRCYGIKETYDLTTKHKDEIAQIAWDCVGKLPSLTVPKEQWPHFRKEIRQAVDAAHVEAVNEALTHYENGRFIIKNILYPFMDALRQIKKDALAAKEEAA